MQDRLEIKNKSLIHPNKYSSVILETMYSETGPIEKTESIKESSKSDLELQEVPYRIDN